jgi:hypothetical protein
MVFINGRGGDYMSNKRNLITAILGTFCLTTLLFMVAPTRSQTNPEYDPWKDVNDDGKIDILDITSLTGIYGAQGTPINKTELLLDLESRVNTLEEESNKVKTLRFYTPNETYANDDRWFTAAIFTWNPENTTNNAVLSCIVYFDSKLVDSGMVDASYQLEINGYVWSWGTHEGAHDYGPIRVYDITISYPVDNAWAGIGPNAETYTITFRNYAGYGNNWVKNINVVLTVMDGLPAF